MKLLPVTSLQFLLLAIFFNGHADALAITPQEYPESLRVFDDISRSILKNMVDPNFEGYEEFHSSMLHKPNSIYLAIEKECAKMHDAKIEEEEDIFLAVTALITTIPNWSQEPLFRTTRTYLCEAKNHDYLRKAIFNTLVMFKVLVNCVLIRRLETTKTNQGKLEKGKALQEYLKNHGEDAAFLKLPEVEELNELYKIVTLKSQTKQADLLVFANTLKKEKCPELSAFLNTLDLKSNTSVSTILKIVDYTTDKLLSKYYLRLSYVLLKFTTYKMLPQNWKPLEEQIFSPKPVSNYQIRESEIYEVLQITDKME